MKPVLKKNNVPKTPGYYWVYDPEDRWELDPRIVLVRDYAGHLAIDNTRLEGWESMQNSYWSDKIECPEKPTE